MVSKTTRVVKKKEKTDGKMLQKRNIYRGTKEREEGKEKIRMDRFNKGRGRAGVWSRREGNGKRNETEEGELPGRNAGWRKGKGRKRVRWE